MLPFISVIYSTIQTSKQTKNNSNKHDQNTQAQMRQKTNTHEGNIPQSEKKTFHSLLNKKGMSAQFDKNTSAKGHAWMTFPFELLYLTPFLYTRTVDRSAISVTTFLSVGPSLVYGKVVPEELRLYMARIFLPIVVLSITSKLTAFLSVHICYVKLPKTQESNVFVLQNEHTFYLVYTIKYSS